MSQVIQGERVFLRPLGAADAELYRRWRADAKPMAPAGWRDPAPLSLAQVEARIERLATAQGDDIYNFLICLRSDERPIGEIMLADVDRRNGSAEVGIFIGEPDEWGKGYGTDAINALVDFGFAELRLERIWLEVWTENSRAIRSYEKAGFVHEGTIRNDRYEFGRLTSGHIMSILHDEWLTRSSAPAS
ncbi:MAG TPA: GNAT family protein [Candidatus Limnocylindria bacterium]|nr:GNAT family protein [Candidatus Limnocylindria bacterium]